MKYFNFYIPLLLGVLLTNCNSSNQANQIPLFGGKNFTLNSNDTINKIDSIAAEKYSAIFENNSSPIPLYRVVNSKSYNLFIGIPFNVTLKKLINNRIINSNFELLNTKSDSSTYIYRQYSLDSLNTITEYVVALESNLIYTVINSKKQATDSLFTLDKIKSRFQ